jgi:hypothetical protein
MLRHYGERLFKCRHIYCSFRRHGFDSKASRNLHEREHEKPWNCHVEGCEFEEGGFLSRKMRDEHLERFHSQSDLLPIEQFKKLDEVDLKNVCLDLVKADDVSKIRELSAAGQIGARLNHNTLIPCAAQYASPEMIKILLNDRLIKLDLYFWSRGSFSKLFLPEVVAGNKSNMLEYILYSIRDDWPTQLLHNLHWFRDKGLAEVLAKANDEMLDVFCRWVAQDLLQKKTTPYLVRPDMIAATAGDVYREHLLLRLWRKVPCSWWTKNNWKNAVINVASTTCSTELATFLIDQGVPVDWRNSKAAPTPLVHAARKTDARAANLVRLLLLNGADSVVDIAKRALPSTDLIESRIDVSEQKGAREISNWLGVTFDELVVQAKKAREEVKNLDT